MNFEKKFNFITNFLNRTSIYLPIYGLQKIRHRIIVIFIQISTSLGILFEKIFFLIYVQKSSCKYIGSSLNKFRSILQQNKNLCEIISNEFKNWRLLIGRFSVYRPILNWKQYLKISQCVQTIIGSLCGKIKIKWRKVTVIKRQMFNDQLSNFLSFLV